MPMDCAAEPDFARVFNGVLMAADRVYRDGKRGGHDGQLARNVPWPAAPVARDHRLRNRGHRGNEWVKVDRFRFKSEAASKSGLSA